MDNRAIVAGLATYLVMKSVFVIFSEGGWAVSLAGAAFLFGTLYWVFFINDRSDP